jgi:glycosyltransferase involved in cell wall biosynthesis
VLAGAELGGAENFFVRLVAGLQQSGKISQKAFIRNHQNRIDSLQQGGLTVSGFRFGGVLNVLDNIHYHCSLSRFAPDIVMTWMNRASGLTPRGPYKLVCRLGHYYNLKYYRHADYWVGNTKGICDYLIRGGMPADKIFHIPNFADETPVDALPRDSFNTPAGVPLLLSAGRLHVNKGFDILLKALKDVPDAFLWLAGSGPEELALKRLCNELDLQHRVRFLGWRNDVTALMRTADMFICPSRNEGLGSIVMESWAHECPIVATNSQGPGESINDGENGLLTPVDDPVQLASAIIGLLDDPELNRSLICNAKELYWQNYSRAVIVNRYEDCYSRISHC